MLNSFSQHTLWRLPFRSCFLLAAIASSASLLIWIALLNGWIQVSAGTLSPSLWHAHEMLFGFGATVVVGFILTAVQTWTGEKSMHGKPVILLTVLWLLSRTFIWLNQDLTIMLAAVSQACWWLLSIVWFARLVIRTANRRNYLFIPLLSVLASVNLIVLIASLLEHQDIALHLARSCVLLFTLVMGIVGGRVIPFFTVRGANTDPVTPALFVERLLLPVAISGITVFIVGYFITLPFTPAALMISTGLLHLLRMTRWKGLKTISVPLLWSLHIAYGFMALGLITLGLSYLPVAILSFSNALHLITVGAMGLMILSMMSRVSLGHTGRPLVVKPVITFALLLMVVTTLIRVVLPQLGFPLAGWTISALLWAICGLAFVTIYTPILLKS